MTDYSLNEQFDDLAQNTLQEQESNNNNNQEMKQNNNNNNNSVSAKNPDLFQGNNAIKKKKKNKFKAVHDVQNKNQGLSFQHILCWSYQGRFLQQKFCI